MSLNWKAYARCPLQAEGTGKLCNADRAILIAEGERLQAERDAFGREAFDLGSNAYEMQATISKLETENARLHEALELVLSTHDRGHSPCFCIEARAALSGEVKP